MSTVADIIDTRYGGRIAFNEQVVTLMTPLTRLLVNNPNRVGWVMINEGTDIVRLAPNPQVTPTSGWLLAPSGGIMSMSWDEDGDAVFSEVWAAISASSVSVRVREYIRL